MFSLFAALFGGTYIYAKYHNDKAKIKQYDNQYNALRREADEFHRRFSVSVEYKKEIEGMVLNSTSTMVKFEKELTKIIGMKPTHPMLVWGFLAKQGKIPDQIVMLKHDNVLKNDHDLIWHNIEPWSNLTVQQFRLAKLRFLVWYDKELRNNGMPYELMFIPPHYKISNNGNSALGYHILNAKSISACDDLCPMITGNNSNTYPVVVFWMPERLYLPAEVEGTI